MATPEAKRKPITAKTHYKRVVAALKATGLDGGDTVDELLDALTKLEMERW